MRAAAWLHASVRDGSSWDGDALVVETGCSPAIADGAIAAGPTFERDALPN